MSEAKQREVTYGVIGGAVHVPQVGHFGPTLSATTTGSKVIKMFLNDSETLVDITAKDSVGKPFILSVPVAYFTTLVIAR